MPPGGGGSIVGTNLCGGGEGGIGGSGGSTGSPLAVAEAGSFLIRNSVSTAGEPLLGVNVSLPVISTLSRSA